MKVEPAALRASKRFFAADSHAATDVTAFMYAHASSTFFDPFGTTQPFPLNIVIGPPLRFVKNLATRSTFGELFENTL